MRRNLVRSGTGLALALAGSVLAQPAAQSDAGVTIVHAHIGAQRLSDGFPSWDEVGLRMTHARGPHVFHGELLSARRWGERGVYAGAGDTYTFDQDWYGSLNVGAGDGASYLPRVRVDASVNRKLLPGRNLVATSGLAYYEAPDGHIDRSLALGAIYYFSAPWVIQAEVRFTQSNPGSVDTRQQFVAASWGKEGIARIVARHAWGSEGYQAIGELGSLVNFRSRETSVGARYWLGDGWGIEGRLERYSNPTYRRTGAVLGLFVQFP